MRLKWDPTLVLNQAFIETSLLMESVAVHTWSIAKKSHSFTNRTGELEKSIRIEKKDLGNGLAKFSVLAGVGHSTGGTNGIGAGGSDTAYYPHYVELGTSKMAAKPFLRPAFEKALAQSPLGRNI